MKATLVITTTDTQKEAEELAHALVSDKLAACVNIIPQMTSIYAWNGETQRAQEFLLLIKSAQHLYPELEAHLKNHHSYDTPECISVPLEKIESQFGKWMVDSLKKEL